MQYTADWTDDDLEQLNIICTELEGSVLDLLGVMYAESGCKASALNDNPKVRYKNGVLEEVPLDERYNAAGLIQCMPFILKGMGFHPELGPRARAEAFTKLTVGQQLPYVRKYFLPYKGALPNRSAWYLATFLPAYISHANEPDYVLATKGASGFSGAVYVANSGFDANGDSKIVVSELSQAILRNCVGKRWGELSSRISGQHEITPITSITPVPRTLDLGAWRDIQATLKLIGLYHGEVDGIWGPKSQAALLEFQKAHPPLTPDGIYGPKTRAVLRDAHDALFARPPSVG